MPNSIQVYLRVRPTKRPSGYFETVDEETGRVDFNIPTNLAQTHVNNTKSQYKFKFDGILDQDADQNRVFQQVALNSIQGTLEGYNSTIFAYGQTGSGKTFTITGGAERYADRGIIPRTLSTLFQECEKRNKEGSYSVYISYLEIYNEQGYDLLSSDHTEQHRQASTNKTNNGKGFEGLPRVMMLEDDEGNVHLKNLSMHPAASEEDALNLLFLGDTNRAIAETPMNLASSRSHCIFTISIESRKSGSDVIRSSKLHIVDLAGSERVHKTSSGGQLLREAKYINSSLHYLEMVIVALHEKRTKGRSHIPYRNSMMTSVLRDSLGGNSRTSMIATISAEASNTEESISTCRFAQRVALVENNAFVNEELDPMAVIQRLKGELKLVKEEMSYLKGEQTDDVLDLEEKQRVVRLVEQWVDDDNYIGEDYDNDTHDPENDTDKQRKSENRLVPGPLTFERIHFCFNTLKSLVIRRSKGQQQPQQYGDHRNMNGSQNAQTNNHLPMRGNEVDGTALEEMSELRSQLQQRDNEIAILVNMVKGQQQQQQQQPETNIVPAPHYGNHHLHVNPEQSSSREVLTKFDIAKDTKVIIPKFQNEQEALEWFTKQSHHRANLEENKNLLKTKYMQAKEVAEEVNQARLQIEELRTKIEHTRTQRVVQELGFDEMNNESKLREDDDRLIQEEKKYMDRIDDEKIRYKSNYQDLKTLKVEIEQIKRCLKQNKVKLQLDFNSWYQLMVQNKPSEEATATTPQEEEGYTKRDESKEPELNHPYKVKEQQDKTNSQLSSTSTSIPLTGNQEADSDILAFFQAKERLLQKRRESQQQHK